MTRALLVAVLLGFIIGCGVNSQTVAISDVLKPEVMTLRKLRSQAAIHRFSISGNGSIDGVATLTLLLNGKAYKTQPLAGPVDFTWSGDWYSDSAEVRYLPGVMKSGKLKLIYRFDD